MEQKLASVNDIAGKTFDFVVIGGGTAGLVVAARLTENPNVSVAVLEAGKAHFNDPLILAPDGWMKQVLNPEYDWVFRTVPQKRAENTLTSPDGLGTPSFAWSRGKGLGGSSAINFLAWTRPQREEVDALEALGNPGWNWERFHKASKKSEKFCAPAPSTHEYRELWNSESVGHDGPIPVSFARTSSGVEFPLQKSLDQHGVETINDGLGGQISGTWKSVSIVNPTTGTRSYAVTGYLQPALDRPNLKVLPEAYVTKILTSGPSAEVVAHGVEFEHGGATHQVHAAKEVVLSAGAIKSPQILELSGIGDRAILEPLGIAVKRHLPTVGANVQDHLILTAFVFEMRMGNEIITSDTIRDPKFQSKLREAYGDVGGPLALVMTGLTFLPIQSFSERAAALIQAQTEKFAREAETYPPGLKEQYAVQLEMLKKENVPDIEVVVFPFSLKPDDSGRPFVGLLPSIGHPFSRGTIHVASADPKAQPEIEPNYLAEQIDLETLVDAFKFLRKVTDTDPFKSLSVTELLPGPSVATDDQIREFISKNLSTTWHTCGSCSMLPEEKGGVVDPKLKVYGTKNIRVVDLSILSVLTVVHTQATTYGIAEQAADIIKADYGL